jgi:2-polyprenyl-3-methyl-5-hydroxy-6-metoxy-1,4-benzoquinol methylase
VQWEILKNKLLDVFGQAILDYSNGDTEQVIITETNISEADVLAVSYLFRSYDKMPILEQKAIALTKGNILDVGCGAGSHALYLQNSLDKDVLALDASKGAITACKRRGIKQTVCTTIQDYNEQQFDTILLLMNGIGLAQKRENLLDFLLHLKTLLNPNGQLLLDSSDIAYMYDKDDLEEIETYYGTLKFTISYKTYTETFDWLFVDFDTLKQVALAAGLSCERVLEGKHYDYLAKLTKIT